jgi:hypothetical protein
VKRAESTEPDEHLLAVGCDHVLPVGYHPVDAPSAYAYVFRCRVVDDVDDVDAASAGELILSRFTPQRTLDQEVVALCTYYVVRI